MKTRATDIPGVVILEPRVFSDSRGFFLESWNENRLREAGIDANFVQDNHSHSAAGVLRGIHYQLEKPQGKLVRVVHGEVFDVAVDLRRSSPTFGHWIGLRLSAENQRMLWMPPGCAHGYYALSDADFLYKCSTFYEPADERTIRWDDPELAIDWPIDDRRDLLMSDKDKAGMSLSEAETYP